MKKGLIIVLIFLSNTVLSQGLLDGFSAPKKSLDAVLNVSYQTSTQYYAGTNLIKYGRNLTMINLFGKYGLTDTWDLALSIPFVKDRFQDVTIGSKYKLIAASKGRSKFDLFGGFIFSTPMGKYPTESALSVGQRTTQLQPKLIMQYEILDQYFIQAQGGYSYALAPVTSAYVGSVKIGYHGSRWYFDAWYDKQVGIGDKDFQGQVPYSSFRELVVSYDRVGFTIFRGVENNGFSLTGSYVLAGRNMWKATTIGVAYIRKFKF